MADSPFWLGIILIMGMISTWVGFSNDNGFYMIGGLGLTGLVTLRLIMGR